MSDAKRCDVTGELFTMEDFNSQDIGLYHINKGKYFKRGERIDIGPTVYDKIKALLKLDAAGQLEEPKEEKPKEEEMIQLKKRTKKINPHTQRHKVNTEKVYSYIHDNPGCSAKEISSETGISEPVVRGIINNYKHQSKIRSEIRSDINKIGRRFTFTVYFDNVDKHKQKLQEESDYVKKTHQVDDTPSLQACVGCGVNYPEEDLNDNQLCKGCVEDAKKARR